MKHQKVIDKKIKPHLDKINSGLDKKIDLRTLYQRGAVVNDDGTRGLMIRRETKSAMGLSLTKTVITSYRGKNLSTVGSVANREKLGITGQGKMTKVAEIKDPRLIEYKMPVELEMWQSQSVDPKGATTRSVGAQIASKVGVKSAFDVLNYYIDNHVLNFDPNSPIKNSTLVVLSTVAISVAFVLLLLVAANTSVLSVASTKSLALSQDIAKYPDWVVETLKLVGAPGAFKLLSIPESWLYIKFFLWAVIA